MTFGRLHRSAAVSWLVTTLLFVAISVVAGALFSLVDSRRARRGDKVHYPSAVPSLTVAESHAVLARFRTIARRSVWQPWIGWSELPFHSPNVNVDFALPVPTRRTVSPRNSAAKQHRTVWLFGGSTALGFSVTDDQTVAAHLQRALSAAYPALDVDVVNHGHLGHFSSQEVALFQWLLRAGRRADAAVFLDGFNDSRFLYDSVGNAPPAAGDEPYVRRTVTISPNFPPARIGRFILKRLPARQRAPVASPRVTPEEQGAMAAKRYAVNVMLARATARPFGIAPLFVWQPTPYDYFDLAHDADFLRVRDIYPRDPVVKPMNAAVRASIHAADFLFLAPMFEGRSLGNTYVDSVHYGDNGSRLLAQAIARAMIERNALRMTAK